MIPRVLIVASARSRAGLLPLLERELLYLEWATGFEDAVRMLSGPHSYDLLIADAELPGGSWRNLLLYVQNSGKPCEMIICSRVGEHALWAEVLQTGAFDLIPEPFERQEVGRIVHSAIDSGHMRRFSRPEASLPAFTQPAPAALTIFG